MQVDEFQAWPAITEAWQRVRGARLTYLGMAATLFIIMFLLGSLLNFVLPAPAAEFTTGPDGELMRSSTTIITRDAWMPGSFTAHNSLIGTLISALVAALFTGSFTAYALRRAQGLDVSYAMLTKYLRYALPIFMLALASYLASMLLEALGPMLATMMFFAGTVAFAFTHMFVVDRDLGALRALEASLRVVSRNVWQTLVLLLIGGVLTFAVAIPIIIFGGLLPVIGGVVLGLAIALAVALVQALMLVATACAYRDAVGIEKSGGDLPIGGHAAPATLSSRA